MQNESVDIVSVHIRDNDMVNRLFAKFGSSVKDFDRQNRNLLLISSYHHRKLFFRMTIFRTQ